MKCGVWYVCENYFGTKTTYFNCGKSISQLEEWYEEVLKTHPKYCKGVD